ncbi:MAG TPA: DPP IV N-terminal domain-containing protein [Acidimicrobiia bacterium]
MSVLTTLVVAFMAGSVEATHAAVPEERERLVYVSNGGTPEQASIWVADPDGGNARNLTGSLGIRAFDPKWSSDGFSIAFTSDGEIWSMNPDGSAARYLTGRPNRTAFFPEWSPDGSMIAFRSLEALWVVDRDGGNARRLVDYFYLEPVWSPDGSRIAYEVQTGMVTMDIWTVDVDTAARSNLTSGANSFHSEPAWSPDGSRIVFSSDRDGQSGLWVIDAGGGQPVKLAGGSGVRRMMYPAWSPDGERIAFVSDDDLWVIGADGAGAVRLTDTPDMAERLPAWSPDGSRVAFDAGSDVWVVEVDTGLLTNVSNSFPSAEWAPSWRPLSPPLGLVDTVTGVWHLRSWGEETQFYFGNPGDDPFVGDWDCDGVETPGLFRTSDAFVYLRNSNTQGVADIRFFFGNPGDLPLAGDFDGDGCDTVSIYRPSEQRFYIIDELGSNEGGLGTAEVSFVFGDPGDQPVVGDWDGDGGDEIGLYRESTGFFYYRDSLSAGVADGQFYFGDPGDRIVSGDWGIEDGVETPGLFRPGNTMFYLRHTLSQGVADGQTPWPGSGPRWVPIAGDFGL